MSGFFFENNNKTIFKKLILFFKPMKNFTCEECLKEFYTKTEFQNHEKNCGEFKCSSMEREVINGLDDNQIAYEFDKNYDSLLGIHSYRLRWDFILNINGKILLIETDGRQHEQPVNFGGCSDEKALDKFNKIKINDKIKDEYAQNNNVPLLRIKYDISKKKYNFIIMKFILENTFKSNSYS